MSIKIEYSGYFYKELPRLLMEKDGFSLGQKLAQIEKTAKRKFIDMSDEDIYNSLKQLIETKDYYKDEMPDKIFWDEYLKEEN